MTTRSYASLLLTCCVVSFICFFSSYLRIPVVPLYAAELGANTTQIGLINAAFMLMAGVLAIPAGLISDRVGQRKVILGGLLIIGSSSFLLYWCTTPTEMIVVYLLFGVGLAAYSPAMMSNVANIAPPTHLGRAYGMYTIAINVAMMLGPASGGLVGHVLGLRNVFLISGGLTLAMVFVAGVNLPAVVVTPGPQRSVWPSLRALLHRRGFLACLLATLGGCFGFGVFMTFLPLYLTALGMDASHVGMVFAVQALANALSRIPFGRLSDRVTDRGILVVGGLGALSVSIFLVGMCSHLAELFGCAAMLGVSMGVAFTALSALIADIVPHELRGMAMGGYNSCIYLGMMASASTMGGVIAKYGYKAGFIGASATTLILTWSFIGIYRKSQTTLPV